MLNHQDSPEDEALLLECVTKITNHLERNIVKHRGSPQIANKLASMNKYIASKYLSTTQAV